MDRRPSRYEKSGISPAPNAATSEGNKMRTTVSTRKVVTIADDMTGEMFFFVIGVAVGGGRKGVEQPSSGVLLYEPDGDHDVTSPFITDRADRHACA